tara:strand:+ start:747 stop:1934 length:1188 start_codon:yes stop_codon:yes gene_type:complete
MSDDIHNNDIVDSVEEQELVENEEVLDEETLEEMSHGDKKKKKVHSNKHYEGKHEDEEEEKEQKEGAHEDEEDDEEVKEYNEQEVKQVEIPKTKAAVIQATVDMMKNMKSAEAKAMYAQVMKVDGVEPELKSEKEAENAVKKQMPVPKAKAKVEAIDFDEDLDAIIKEEATLSEGFRGKASAIFEAVLTSKLSEEVERLEAEYANNLEEEVSEVHTSLVEKVDSYLNYVVEGWMKENELAVQQGLRTEIAEEFMTSLQQVFKEHYIEVPEGKDDLVDDLNEQVTELEDTLNKTTDENIKLHEAVQSYEKAQVIREQSSGLAETEAEKLASLVEDIEFDNVENFEVKVKTVKESYFSNDSDESVDEVDSLLGAGEMETETSDSMSRYTQAITNHIK